MAKVGEGDSRWIVQNRSDGKNVGDWHWTERNVLPIFKRHVQALDKAKIPSDGANFKISSVENVKGDMDVCNRRGKIIFIYDCTIKFKWRGVMRKNGEKVSGKGTIEITDIDNSNEFYYKYTQDGQNANNRDLLAILKKAAPKYFNDTILGIIENMRMELCNKEESSTDLTEPVPSLQTRNISQEIIVGGSKENLYRVFTDSQMLSSLTDTHCDIELVQGSQFYLLEGGVTGSVVTYSQNEMIEYRWRFADWTEDHFSTVKIEFQDFGLGNEKTCLKFSQQRIPEEQVTRTLEIWESCFWSKLPLVFGWHIFKEDQATNENITQQIQ